MKLYFFLALLLLGGILYSQDNNPFDIPQAGDASTDEPITTEIETRLTDPVASTGQSLDSSTVTTSLPSISIDSLSINQEPNPFDIGSDALSTETIGESPDQGFTNPIDIGHTMDGEIRDTRLVVLIFVLVMFIILSLAVSLDRKRCGDVFKSMVNSNNMKTLYRETNAWTNGQTVIFYLSFFLIGSFLIWLLSLKYFGSDSMHLWWIALALILCYLIRHFTVWLLGTVYPLGPEVGQFNYSIMLHNIVLAIFLLPVVLAVEFVAGIDIKTYVFLAGGIFLLVYAFRQIKGIISMLSMRGFSPLYFFIYLCAVEIAPIMVFYKIIAGAL